MHVLKKLIKLIQTKRSKLGVSEHSTLPQYKRQLRLAELFPLPISRCFLFSAVLLSTLCCFRCLFFLSLDYICSLHFPSFQWFSCFRTRKIHLQTELDSKKPWSLYKNRLARVISSFGAGNSRFCGWYDDWNCPKPVPSGSSALHLQIWSEEPRNKKVWLEPSSGPLTASSELLENSGP